MSRRDALLLLLLSAIWGSSFLFIKLGVDVLEPSVVVLASGFYASAGIYSQLHLRGTTSGPVLASGSMLAGGLILLPLAIAQPPTTMPTAGAIGCLLLLSLVGTALAQLILFRVIALFGARRFSLVTYLMPGIALGYGALILDEQIELSSLIGLALILLGVATGSGTLRLRSRRSSEAVDPTS